MNQLLLQYSYLQMLDFLTTEAFLLHGIQNATCTDHIDKHGVFRERVGEQSVRRETGKE